MFMKKSSLIRGLNQSWQLKGCIVYIIYTLHINNSGADNSNNSSNPDTSMKFGKKHLYVILFKNQS